MYVCVCVCVCKLEDSSLIQGQFFMEYDKPYSATLD